MLRTTRNKIKLITVSFRFKMIIADALGGQFNTYPPNEVYAFYRKNLH